MSAPDDRKRELIVEEVAEAEAALVDLSRFTADELEAMNDRLGHLRTQASSLGLPIRKIEQLKLRVTGALGTAKPGKAPATPKRTTPTPAPKPSRSMKDRTKAVEDLFK